MKTLNEVPQQLSIFASTWGTDYHPLRVTAHLSAPTIVGMALHLDSMLAFAAIEQATRGVGIDNILFPFAMPLPLKTLWSASNGLPMYACTNFEPKDMLPKMGVRYIGKRALESKRHVAGRIDTATGRHKEMHRPMRTSYAESFVADCIGDASAIASLLSSITAIGKKRAIGGGKIVHWEIESIAHFTLVDASALPRRAIPIDAYNSLISQGYEVPYGGTIQRLGFTPPYWDATLHMECMGHG